MVTGRLAGPVPSVEGRSGPILRGPLRATGRSRALPANLDVPAVDREREAVRGVVVTERLGLRQGADAQERRDVGGRVAAFAVVGDVPPGSQSDDRRIVGRTDDTADP